MRGGGFPSREFCPKPPIYEDPRQRCSKQNSGHIRVRKLEIKQIKFILKIPWLNIPFDLLMYLETLLVHFKDTVTNTYPKNEQCYDR